VRTTRGTISTANLAGYGVKDHVTAIKGLFEEEVPRLYREGVRVGRRVLDGQHDEESVRRDPEPGP